MRFPRLRRRPERDASVADRLQIQLGAVDDTSGEVVGDVFAATATDHGPIIVTLHGWSGRREDLTQFAIGLADRGAVVCNAAWRGNDTGLDDAVVQVRRAVAFAKQRWNRPVTLVGWSDGALIAALAVLDDSVASDALPAMFVGLGGYYGWASDDVPINVVNDRTIELFGGPPEAVAARWSAANPHCWIKQRPGQQSAPTHLRLPRFRLVVGEHDLTGADARQFHNALRSAGHDPQLHVVEGCDVHGLVVPRHAPGAAASDLVVELATDRTERDLG